MFRSIFNSDNWFFKPFGWLVDIVCLSVCWWLGSVLILPFGAATAALYDSCARCLRKGELGAYARFWNTLKESLRTGAVVGVPMLAVCLGLGKLHWAVYALADTGSRGWGAVYVAFWVILAVVNGILAFVFPLLSRFEFTASGLVSTALKLAMAHLPSTFLLGVWTTGCLAVVFMQWLTAFFVPCLWLLGTTVVLERIFRPYICQKRSDDLF